MKGFYEQNYPCIIEVKVTWADGDSVIDQIKGLNEGHAVYNAFENWPSASEITKIRRVTK
jgi:hypothetical protein